MYFKTISYTFKKLLYLLRSYPWSWDVKQASCTSHAHPDKEHYLQPLPDGTPDNAVCSKQQLASSRSSICGQSRLCLRRRVVMGGGGYFGIPNDVS